MGTWNRVVTRANKGELMKLKASVWLASAVLLIGSLTACSQGSPGMVPSDGELTGTVAYLEGYTGNTGLSAAMLSNFGSARNYCEGNLLLHPEYKSKEKTDYMSGCLDVINDELSLSADEPSEGIEVEPEGNEGTVDNGSSMTVSQENAVRSAQSYLDYSAFSRTGLIEQLEYEEFSTSDATFAVDSLQVNWNEQAAKAAADYLEYSAFSRQGLIDQLIYEGYTQKQAEYGVNTTGL